MYAYRNTRTGQIVESAGPKERLERLDVWERVQLAEGEGAAWELAAPSPETGKRPVVWFVSPAWQRFAVTRLALAQRQHAIGELAARGIDANCVIVADDENLELAAEHGFPTVEMDNTRLGRRFNAGIGYACREGGADYIVHVGSDDWVHPDVFSRLPGPSTILSGRTIAIVDLERGRLRRLHVRSFHGVIPWIIPRTLLEPSRFAPVKPEKSRGIDGSLVRGLRVKPRWAFHDPHDYARVDFKSSVNLTPYELLARNLGNGPEATPWGLLEPHYPADLVAQARETHLTLAAARKE